MIYLQERNHSTNGVANLFWHFRRHRRCCCCFRSRRRRCRHRRGALIFSPLVYVALAFLISARKIYTLFIIRWWCWVSKRDGKKRSETAVCLFFLFWGVCVFCSSHLTVSFSVFAYICDVEMLRPFLTLDLKRWQWQRRRRRRRRQEHRCIVIASLYFLLYVHASIVVNTELHCCSYYSGNWWCKQTKHFAHLQLVIKKRVKQNFINFFLHISTHTHTCIVRCCFIKCYCCCNWLFYERNNLFTFADVNA